MSQAGPLDVIGAHPEIPTSFPTNMGTAVPIANVLEILGNGSIFTTGVANIVTIELINLTDHNVLVGAGNTTITKVPPSATPGIPLVSNGASLDPSFTTAVVAGGGTGSTTFTPNSLIISNTTSTGPLTGLGAATDGQLPIGSTGVAPVLSTITAGTGISITNAAGSITVAATGGVATTYTADSGSATPAANNLNLLGSGSITSTGSGSTITYALTGLTNHNVLIGAGNATITKVAPSATPGIPLVSNGSSLDPSFTVAVVAGGGTGQSTLTNHGVLVGAGTSAITQLLAGSAGQVLQSGGASADPSYSTATYPSTTTINQILYSSSANVISGLTTGNNGVLITGTTGIPSILAAGTTGQVLTATTGSPPSWASPATGGTVTSVSVVSANGFAGTVATATTTPAITLTTTVTGVLSGDGTAISGSAVTQFDVLVGGASNAISSIGPGSAGQVLQSGGNAANPVYSTATYPATATGTGTLLRADGTNWVATTSTYPNTNAVSTLLYASASNVMSALATGNNGVLITGTTGIPSILAAGTTGQVLTATTGSPPSWASPATGGTTWTDEGTNFNAVSSNGYFITAAAIATLPASPSQGNTISFIVDTTSALTITANTGQVIRIGSQVSASAGTAVSTARGDSVVLVYRSSDTAWICLSGAQGVWTVT